MFSEPTSQASSEEKKTETANTPGGHELELLLADSWNRPLRKRLFDHLQDTVSPEKLPPLRLTSRPVDVGMLAGDILSLPWYRTVFTNLGDVISPETLPPLQLESRPVDVGELIGDQMSHMWWTSLLRSLADAAAPERLPALQLTSAPMDDPSLTAGAMQLPRWSSVISTPKVFLPDKPKAAYAPAQPRVAAPPPKPDPAEVEFVHVLEADLKRDLRRSIFRQRLWVSLAVLEVLALIGTSIWWK
jgi:hypothetical protein